MMIWWILEWLRKCERYDFSASAEFLDETFFIVEWNYSGSSQSKYEIERI